MPHTYSIDPNDGNIHSRFTELKMCTLPDPNRPDRRGQLDRLVAIMTGELEPFRSPDMDFGTDRHDMFEAESLQSGKIPACFREIAGINQVEIDIIEQEFAVELAPGVVIHSRPDAISTGIKTIFDYKTVLDAKVGWKKTVQKYRQPSNNQTTFYAMMLGYHGIEINRAVYLCEIWDAEREHILGYDSVEREITPADIAAVHEWALERILLLKVAIKQAQKTKEFYASR